METMLHALGHALGQKTTVNVVLFCLAALVGQLLHGVRQWLAGETAAPFEWFTTHLRATFAALIGNIGIAVGAISLLPIDHMTAWASVFAGFLGGFSSDALLNKGKRAAWSDDRRAAVIPPKPGEGPKPEEPIK